MEENEAKKRVSVGHLSSILGCDTLIRLSISSKDPSKEKERILEILQRGLKDIASHCFEHWSSDKEVFLGFALCTEDNARKSNNIIMGPYAELKEESKSFRDFWGSECKIRRFLDGTIKETIEIENRSGPSYLALAIIQHLKSIHFDSIALSGSFYNLSPFVPMTFQGNEALKVVRAAYSSLVRLLQDEASTDSLPIRKVRCIPRRYTTAGTLSAIEPPKPLPNALLFDLQSSEQPHPTLLESLPIRLDITTKKYLSPELFSKLRLAYLIDLQRKFSKNLNLSSWIKNGELVLLYKGFNWRIGVEEPVKKGGESNEASGSIYEFFYHLSLRFPSWSGSCWAVRQWISSRFLDGVIPEVSLDIILAHVFLNPLLPSAPASVESAFLRFLDFLSFTDFKETPLILNFENCLSQERRAVFDKSFTLERARLPPLASLTIFDDPHSQHTSAIGPKDLTRLVNCARQSLYSFLSPKGGGLVNLSSFEIHLDKFQDKSLDALIHLLLPKEEAPPPPLHTASNKGKKRKKDSSYPLPILDFDPLGYIWRRSEPPMSKPGSIGVKFNAEALSKTSSSMMKPHGKRRKDSELEANPEAMLEDFRILGKGFVKSVTLLTHS
ncbi:Nucleolar protein 6 [Caligus rogercresseyi]|uniref:Nucleolar protein 6 n=1 Tax=Caligus rogercresseyi TaxID=217165 RepID=A0A7T8GPQ3_CALRO|nr:Nucleolar protein 6 [Caligus rogercresseyi]